MPKSSLVSGAVQTLVAAFVLLAVAWLAGDFDRISLVSLSLAPLFSLAYLSVFGLAIGYSIFAWLDRSSGPVLANTFHYVSPVIAMIAGVTLLREPITAIDIIAAVIALFGVALMISATPGKPGKER